MSQKPPQLGFFDGFKAPFQAFSFIGRHPETWPTALVPAALFVLLSGFAIFAGMRFMTPELFDALGFQTPDTWYATAGQWMVRAAFYLLSIVFGLWIALLATPPLSAPALEHLVALREAALGAPPRPAIGFLREMLCGLRAQLFAFVFATPVLALLWMVKLLIPPAAVVITPLEFLVLSLAVAWNLFDYPLTLRGVGPSARLAFIASHRNATLGFGVAFAVLFMIPCFGIALLPVGVVAATQLVWRALSAEPDTLPELPRPNEVGFARVEFENAEPVARRPRS